MIKEEYGPQFYPIDPEATETPRDHQYTRSATRLDPYRSDSSFAAAHTHASECVIVKLLPERNGQKKKTTLKRRVFGVPTGGKKLFNSVYPP